MPKPEGPIARARDYYVVALPHAEAAAHVRTHHYAHGASNTSVAAHALYLAATDTLIGTALWMPPTKPAAMTVDPVEWRRVIALSRLVLDPDPPPTRQRRGPLLGGLAGAATPHG